MTIAGAALGFTASTPSKTMQRLIREFIEPEARIAGLRGALLTQQREIDRQVLEHRQKIVAKFVRNLWDRYKRDIKRRGIEMSFVAWLLEKEFFQETFAAAKENQNGFTLEQRMRWVKFVIDRVLNKAASLEGVAGDCGWFLEDTWVELNKRQPESGELVAMDRVYKDDPEGDILETFRFVKSVRGRDSDNYGG